MSSSPGPSPRARVRTLLRGGTPAPPLFIPLAHALAAQVEALPVPNLLADPTKLAKGLMALHQTLDTDGIVCGCAAGVEAEAAGAILDWSTYPPRVIEPPRGEVELTEGRLDLVSAHSRVAAAIEATRRLASTVPGEPALVAVLTGPMSLAGQLAGPRLQSGIAENDAGGARMLDWAGRVGTELARRFCQAGANLVMIREASLPPADHPSFSAWRAAVGPIANIARFHQAAPVLLPLRVEQGQVQALLDQPPGNALLCLPLDTPLPANASRPLGLAVPEPRLATYRPDLSRVLLTTAGELSPAYDLTELRETCQRLAQDLKHFS